jgi:uncharacterized protein YkwD
LIISFFGKGQTAEEQKIWDIKELDKARKTFDLSELEADVILELNKARTNPAKYAELYIKPRLSDYKDKFYKGKVTKEGVVAVNDCIKAMNKQQKTNPLTVDKELVRLAREYTKLQGKTSETGHNTNGQSVEIRFKELLNKGMKAAENISYGRSSGREIVIAQLIDDGKPGRGHRKNNLSSEYTHVGVSFGAHQRYDTMCTIDFCGPY